MRKLFVGITLIILIISSITLIHKPAHAMHVTCYGSHTEVCFEITYPGGLVMTMYGDSAIIEL